MCVILVYKFCLFQSNWWHQFDSSLNQIYRTFVGQEGLMKKDEFLTRHDLEFTVNHHGRGCFLGRQNFIGCYFYDTEEFWWPNLVKSSWIKECFILKGWESILWCNDVIHDKNVYSCFSVIISTCRLSVQIVNVPLACFGKWSNIAVNSNELLYSNNHRTCINYEQKSLANEKIINGKTNYI